MAELLHGGITKVLGGLRVAGSAAHLLGSVCRPIAQHWRSFSASAYCVGEVSASHTVDYEALAAELAAATWSAARFPSQIELAKRWGVDANTASAALRLLVQRGLVALYRAGREHGDYAPTLKSYVLAAERGLIEPPPNPNKPILVVFNEAGGVGKSTITREIAAAAARAGVRVLAIDTDPQATLTQWIWPEGAGEVAPEQTLMYLYETYKLPRPVTTRYGVDLIPAGDPLYDLKDVIPRAPGGTAALEKALLRLRGYDLVVMDTKGSDDPVLNMAITASNLVLVPMQTSIKGLQGLLKAMEKAEHQAAYSELEDAFLGVVPMMYDARTSGDKVALKTLETLIGESPGIAFSPVHMRPGQFRRSEAEGPVSAEGSTLGDIHYTVAQVLEEIARRRNLLGGIRERQEA